MKRIWIAVATTVSSAGAGLGYAASGDPVVLLTVPGAMICVGVAMGLAVGLAVGLAEGIRHRLRVWFGLERATAGPGPEELQRYLGAFKPSPPTSHSARR